ncbi:MAG TPA: chemotaxis response regulator protein-glutamate methylesterase [Caldithrix abyssi]|uniref:Protein-glutamate methylesterase/protein-glutamine glutaminase n=1 Tax=Caldithrix abyssi TaxID=187145 RepID=A0A7V5H596_CALAY|nr:chemotaxis response regulator protein-glutamate methylesterase [Caldisericaceae bacterium]HHE54723.1 chemotaxis response regulator protein-glutamate methylesterase [Caldithrix abyssi]
MKEIKVLIVDDSALVRQVLSRGLEQDASIEVVGTAANPYRAVELINKFHPQVLTLDVEMPRMNGIEFLKRLMVKHPMPVIMVSSLTMKNSSITLEALHYGAIDFVLKPNSNIRNGLQLMLDELRLKIKQAVKANVKPLVKTFQNATTNKVTINRSLKSSETVIAIGASTGGTEALLTLLKSMPADAPGMVVVQHMPAGFTELFARRLNDLTELQVIEAATGDQLKPGKVLIAPGNYHMQLIKIGKTFQVICRGGERVNGHRPSVDVLFRSVARHAGASSIGILLTGMGKDGAEGLLEMRKNGARTLAQDEATSVVFGMPRAAYLNGGAERLANIYEIPKLIEAYMERRM